jgi:hypothetical protein
MDDEHMLREVDARVRRALRSDAVSQRVAAGALADGRASTPRTRRPRLVVVAAVALALCVGAWHWRSTLRRSPVPPPLAITSRGSVLVVDSPDGRRWVVAPAPERGTAGNYVIVLW